MQKNLRQNMTDSVTKTYSFINLFVYICFLFLQGKMAQNYTAAILFVASSFSLTLSLSDLPVPDINMLYMVLT
jgi:hypothetical protein